MRIIRLLVIVIVGFCSAYSLALILPAYFKGAKLLSVQTASMSPIFRPGDSVWVVKVPLSSLKPGDIISYRNPNDARTIVSHRLISINNVTGLLITKGDAVPLNDPPVYPNQIIGKVSRVIPDAGFVLDWLHNPIGLMLGIYFPGLLLLLSEGKRLAAGYVITTTKVSRLCTDTRFVKILR